jgi:hypothetical protein
VSEISANSEVNPSGEDKDGLFAAHVGVDGTSIWSAATSGPSAIAVHLLACILARAFSSTEATAIMVELVKSRRQEIEESSSLDDSQVRGFADRMASQVDITREQLALWDASARAWIQSADIAKEFQQSQLKIITRSLNLPISTPTNTYKNVIDAWKLALTTVNNLVEGMPQSVHNAGVLHAVSAWHIFPNLNLVGQFAKVIKFNDPLVAPGGIVTLGLQMKDPDSAEGVHWSLDLSCLTHYGDPIHVSKSPGFDGSRITVEELYVVAFGSLLGRWNYGVHDAEEFAMFFSCLWECIKPQRSSKQTSHQSTDTVTLSDSSSYIWLLPLAEVGRRYLEASLDCDKGNLLALIGLGCRRGHNFLGREQEVPPQLFGLSDPATLFSLSGELQASSEENAILILRQLAESLGLRSDETIIRYLHHDIHGSQLEYATAVPDDYDEFGKPLSAAAHKRWVEVPQVDGDGCACNGSCVKPEDDLETDDDGSRFLTATAMPARCPCYHAGRNCSWKCRHDFDSPHILCCNLSHRVADLKSQGEESYWTPGPSQPNPNPGSENSWMWTKPPPSFRTSRYARMSIPIDGLRAACEFDPDSYHFEEAFGNQEEQLGPIFENNNSKHFDAIVFRLIAGSPDRVGLYTTEAHAEFSSQPLELSTVISFLTSPHVKVNALRKTIDRFLVTYTDVSIRIEEEATKKTIRGLGIQPTSWAKSLKGLQLADNLLSGFRGANISTSIIFKPLHESSWILNRSRQTRLRDQPDGDDKYGVQEAEQFDQGDAERPAYFKKLDFKKKAAPDQALEVAYHIDSYAAKFACLAMLELGSSCDIDPEGLSAVMAMSSGNSIYIASALLCDPFEADHNATIKRLVGNVGKPGVTMMFPPETPKSRPLSSSWRHVQHAKYDQKLEDSFQNTSLHLRFTTHEIPLLYGVTGGVDPEVTLVESVVALYDHETWVADLDILGSLEKVARLQSGCIEERHTKRARHTRNKIWTSIDNWDELFDQPNSAKGKNVGVLRAHGNWLARLGATVLSVQKGYRTIVLPQRELCQYCVEQDGSKELPQVCIL